MWVRSAKSKETGKMMVVCTDWNGAECFRGEFSDLAEANAAGQDAERRMTLRMQAGEAVTPLTLDEILMSDDELLAELAA